MLDCIPRPVEEAPTYLLTYLLTVRKLAVRGALCCVVSCCVVLYIKIYILVYSYTLLGRAGGVMHIGGVFDDESRVR